MAKANNSSRFLVVTIALALAGYGLYLLNKYLKGLQNPTDSTPSVIDSSFDPFGGNYSNPTTNTNTGGNSGTSVNIDKILSIGSRGVEVKQFQGVLNQIAEKTKDSKISVDGDFGKKTDTLYQKLSVNGTAFQATIRDANRYLTSLSGGGNNVDTSKFYYNPLDMATAIKSAINVSWYQSKCAKVASMCETLKKVYGQGTEFLLIVGREYSQRNDNKLSVDLNKYYNESTKCTCQTSPSGSPLQYSFEPDKIQSIIAQLKSANL